MCQGGPPSDGQGAVSGAGTEVTSELASSKTNCWQLLSVSMLHFASQAESADIGLPDSKVTPSQPQFFQEGVHE